MAAIASFLSFLYKKQLHLYAKGCSSGLCPKFGFIKAMEVKIIQQKTAGCVIAVKGRVDASNVNALHEALEEQIENGVRYLLVDLELMEYISSAGLRVLLLVAKEMQSAGAYMALCGLREGIRQVFEISGFFALFNTFASLQEGLDFCHRE